MSAGLYRPETERDNCGVGLVARVDGVPTRDVVTGALAILCRLEHRGAAGSDPLTGDGAGVLLQIPHEFFSEIMDLPAQGAYGVGQVFLGGDDERATVEAALAAEGLRLLGWRDVPTDASVCGPVALRNLPRIAQVFAAPTIDEDTDALERRLYRARRRCGGSPYFCSFSARTIVYKGLLVPERLPAFYTDLADDRVKSAMAVVHQRFSTNTFPTWERAHPYRLVAHNGEINTLRGNVNRMRAREAVLEAPGLADLRGVVDERGSDSGMFDNVLELLVRAGRSLPHAVAMMVPEAWEARSDLPPALRGFFDYHASLLEPWDGPALMAFTDGRLAGAVLDRNGLRPARYLVTDDGVLVLSSEAGVTDVPPARVVRRGRLGPGQMIVVDTEARRLLDDATVKAELAARRPYAEWVAAEREGPGLPAGDVLPPLDEEARGRALRTHGFTEEDLRLVLQPMAKTGKEPIGAMGDDTALAVLSDRPRLLFDYFKQLFAQVTNPPIDPLREALVMSLRTRLGPEGNLLAETPAHARQRWLDGPVLDPAEMAGVRTLAVTLTTAFDDLGADLEALVARAIDAVRGGATVLVLSDRGVDVPIPSLLALSAVHHGLIAAGLRTRTSLVVESGEAREVMHLCLLLGYGAAAVHPWLAFEVLAGDAGSYVKALHDGLRKVLSKMGISTLAGYAGAQIFEAVGLSLALVDRWFPGTPSRIGGIDLPEVAQEVRLRVEAKPRLESGGRYKWRRDGERHQYEPAGIAGLQHAVRSGNYAAFKRFSAVADAETSRACALVGLLEPVAGEPIPLAEVEPAAEIVKRFRTGAMSFGSISKEAHENLAIAMNRLGGRSNSGEGGEDAARYADERRSAIKQVASGRFGVTAHYLVNADELQIKMAQGAKPGEGGQLPGHKVDAIIARTRFSTPGVGLISPPPHHDIYSIEDLAQLIHDLRAVNPRAWISVKLVSEVGVGTVAAGVAKAGADGVLVSGGSGGTGAAPLSSIHHAGLPWELGLAEAQQVLTMNDLRGRVRLEVDGQLKTGRDVVVAALLGAEQFGFGTAALVAQGCILMRVCHLNTCPVGIATQDPELRRRFAGEPDHVVNFMMFVAEEVREHLARLGFRTLDEAVGRVDRLRPTKLEAHWKARHLDLSPLLRQGGAGDRHYTGAPATVEDDDLVRLAEPALARGARVTLDLAVSNVQRSYAARLAGEVARRHGAAGLPEGTITLRCRGTAGQSFGAFLAPGIDITLDGEANDALAKGMSGGRIAVRPFEGANEDDVIAGNVALYGATGGTLFVRGAAGERFAVRNSGAVAVVEGVGDHGCEYMTRGTVVVLGATGRNFAAGMSGGVAYVLDADGAFASRCNGESVDLEPLAEADQATVLDLLRRHADLTGSPRAWRVLSGWQRWQGRFVKVMPREYRQALWAAS